MKDKSMHGNKHEGKHLVHSFIGHIGIAIGVVGCACVCQAEPVSTVAEFTNAIAKATTGSTIELAAGVTFDFSTLKEYSNGTSWGTMSAPDGKGISCVWWQKQITIKGADDTPWNEKTSAQETILDGGNVARIFYGYGGSGRRSTFKNLTFRNGKASSGQNGGAIVFNNSESTGGAINCVFKECSAVSGGATHSVPVSNSLFEYCSATSQGGGAWCDKNYCILSGNVFRACSAANGGAIYLSDLSASPAGHVTGCIVNNCSASSNGGGLYSLKAFNTVDNCLFRGNGASNSGGALYGGTATGCTFDSNTSTNQGGACYNSAASECAFFGNASLSNRGGAMSLGTAVACAFTNNVCTKYGRGGACDKVIAVVCTFSGKGDVSCGSYNRCTFEGIVPDGNRPWVFDATSSNGSALGVTNCLVVSCSVGRIVNTAGQLADFMNCTFADNVIADNGYTAYCDVNDSASGAISFVNSIFSGNKQVDGSDADMKLWKAASGNCSLKFANCLYTSGLINQYRADVWTDIQQGPAKFVAGDPQFPDEPYYAILRQSKARNTGVNAAWMTSDIDLAGRMRILEDVVDIGCFECNIACRGLTIIIQ